MPLLRFWKMDPSLHGVFQSVEVIVRQFEISSGVCSRFRPQIMPLLRFWKMDPSLHGVFQSVEVIVLQSEMNSGLLSVVVFAGCLAESCPVGAQKKSRANCAAASTRTNGACVGLQLYCFR